MTTPDLPVPSDFIRAIVAQDLKAGKHGLKVGGEYRHTNIFRNAARFARGQLAFNREFTADPQNRAASGDGLAEFMLGWAAGGSLGNECHSVHCENSNQLGAEQVGQ